MKNEKNRHFSAIFRHFCPSDGKLRKILTPTGPPRGGQVKNFFLLKCAENYFRHTTQNSEAYQKPFFAIKISISTLPPPKFASSRKFAKINVNVSIIQSRHKQHDITQLHGIATYTQTFSLR